jgi:hypothetical protein
VKSRLESTRANGTQISERQKIEIALGLIAMRKASKFRAIYVNADHLSVSYGEAPCEDRHPLSWKSAERRVNEFFRARRKTLSHRIRTE